MLETSTDVQSQMHSLMSWIAATALSISVLTVAILSLVQARESR